CGDSVTICARRPLRDVGWVSTTPELVSSLTIVETVAAESPVASISSTCVRPPNSLTVSMTSVRFASRNEDCEPVVRLTAASQAHASGGPSHGRRTAPLAVDVEADRDQQHEALDHLLRRRRDAHQLHAVAHHRHDQAADDRAGDPADAAADGGAADEAGGDRVELEHVARARLGAV